MTHPVIFGFENATSAAIRNLFIEATITSSESSAKISTSIQSNSWNYLLYSTLLDKQYSSTHSHVQEILEEYESEGLRKIGNEWKLTMQWDAIQPQRMRLLKPPIYISTDKSSIISINGKLYSDSIAAPLDFSAKVTIIVKKEAVSLQDLIPDWKDKLKTEKSTVRYFNKRGSVTKP
ncbi:hypothetical protein [Phenylobacterium sp. J367]|uniref:hypothetical protein n=1 Tax=Phenylobacterium sp. J367 TaxID=2898435 RepID=UPI0021507F73|nr:hypothetical protein [Phenylobacterium sp. J367]MCR5879152.1 hypothetical protein [Phenylobacterium sp. J367]